MLSLRLSCGIPACRRLNLALALQIKKFINSEHTGEYASIELPGFADKSGAKVPEEARIHYLEAGIGEPLLLIHSACQSLYTWRNVFNALSEHYRVIALDLLGHGYSSRPHQFDYTIAEHSDSIRMFMDAKGIVSAHIAGFSFGALYALDFAIKHPERTGRLVLSSPGGITPEMPLALRMLQSALFGGLASKLFNRRTVERALSECFFDLTNINAEMLENVYSTIADSHSRRAIQLSIINFDELEVHKELRTIENEALLLWGSEDKWHAPEGSEFYHAAMQNAHFCVIRNAGHLMHEEKGQRFVEAIFEFIPAPVEL